MLRPSENAGIVLISGGLDSAVTGAIARERGFSVHALTISYGQRHVIETQAAARVAASLGVARHVVEAIDLRAFGGSALTGDIEVPKAASDTPVAPGIPVTYVPARNTIFLALALANAEVVGARDVFIGVNAIDYSGYPDCRPAFIAAFECVANLGTKAGIEGKAFTVHTPLIAMTKGDIIREGVRLGVDFSITHSCYDPSPEGLACGRCDSCRLRRQGFAHEGMPDPIRYALE